MPKKASPLWPFVGEEGADGKRLCNVCGLPFALPHGGALTRHFEKFCNPKTADGHDALARAKKIIDDEKSRRKRSAARSGEAAADGAAHKRQMTLAESLGGRPFTAKKLQEKLVRAFLATGTPLSRMHTPAFKDVLEALSRGVARDKSGMPGKFRVPARETANKIGDRVFETALAERRDVVLQDASATGVSISVDGKTVRMFSLSMLNVVVSTSHGSFVLAVEDVSGEVKSNAFMVEFVVRMVREQLADCVASTL